MRKRWKLTGADSAILIFQVVSLLPLLYILVITGDNSVLLRKGIMHTVFNLGINGLPRLEVLGVACIYRLLHNEIIVFYAILLTAFIVGLVMKRKLPGKGPTARRTRWFLIIWVACDLVLRLVPIRLNTAYALPYRIFGFVVQAVILALLVWDLRRLPKE